LREVLKPAIEEKFPDLRSWRFATVDGGIEWYPKEWELDDEEYISFQVLLPNPVDPDDQDPSVNLKVPEEWGGHASFCDRSTELVQDLINEGFGLACENDWDEECPLCKYVCWLERDGSFNSSSLIERIVVEAMAIIQREPAISKIVRAHPFKKSRKSRRK
jgi:hypothetical protein